jgi:hypothetical protein
MNEIDTLCIDLKHGKTFHLSEAYKPSTYVDEGDYRLMHIDEEDETYSFYKREDDTGVRLTLKQLVLINIHSIPDWIGA